MKKTASILGIALLALSLSFSTTEKKTIVIDAGHGGDDNGVIANQLNEKEITLSIANKVKELSEGSDLEIILTRDADDFISLDNRIKKINSLSPLQVISLHINAVEKAETSGFDLYINDKMEVNKKSMEFAEKLSKLLPVEIPFREIQIGNFYLLKNLDYPATLIELGFLTNENDLTYLASKTGQDEIAAAIFNSLR